MASDDLFLSEQHPDSRRWAVVEDDGTVAWLYLTAPDSEKPVADCWLYNRIEAALGLDASREGPPVAPVTDVRVTQPFTARKAGTVSFRWSTDGESVAILFDNDVQGFIAAGRQRGFSKNLRKAGPFGEPIDRELYERLFSQR